MPNYTSNYKLTKPLPTDLYDIEVFNANMDKIDEIVWDGLSYKPTLSELGAAPAKDHNIKHYSSLAQIGLANGASMQEVANALPLSSMLRMYVLTSENANLAPTTTNGWLEVKRPTANHVVFTFVTTSRKTYTAVVLNVGNSNETLSIWTKIMSEEDIISTPTDPGKGVTVNYPDGTVILVYE